MPEHDIKKERILPGEITVTSSSDEAISATVEQLRREISGLPTQNTVVDGDLYPPIAVAGTSESLQEPEPAKSPIDITSRLTPKRSALGLRILWGRLTKKAA